MEISQNGKCGRSVKAQKRCQRLPMSKRYTVKGTHIGFHLASWRNDQRHSPLNKNGMKVHWLCTSAAETSVSTLVVVGSCSKREKACFGMWFLSPISMACSVMAWIILCLETPLPFQEQKRSDNKLHRGCLQQFRLCEFPVNCMFRLPQSIFCPGKVRRKALTLTLYLNLLLSSSLCWRNYP